VIKELFPYSPAARHALDLEDEVRSLRARLAAADSKLTDAHDNVAAAEERAEIRFAAAEASAAANEARLQYEVGGLYTCCIHLIHILKVWIVVMYNPFIYFPFQLVVPCFRPCT
jgi:hypothetical protein